MFIYAIEGRLSSNIPPLVIKLSIRDQRQHSMVYGETVQNKQSEGIVETVQNKQSEGIVETVQNKQSEGIVANRLPSYQ